MSKNNPQRIPAQAKKVFDGVIFNIWQWEQKMYDGSVATFERASRFDTVDVIPTMGNKIVLLRQEQPDSVKPFVSFPGGRVEEGEDMLEAAKRELLEETGLASDDWELWYDYTPVGKIDWQLQTYIARNAYKKADLALDPGEKIELFTVTFDEFLAMSDTDDSIRHERIIPELLRARLDPVKKESLRKKLFG